MSNKLKSRKFWIAVMGAMMLILTDGLGMDINKEVILGAMGVLISYILGESYIDSRKK